MAILDTGPGILAWSGGGPGDDGGVGGGDSTTAGISGKKGGALMREQNTEGGGSERWSSEMTMSSCDGVDGCSTASPGVWGILNEAGAMSGVLAGTLVASSAVGDVKMGVTMSAWGGESETSRSRPTSVCSLSS